MALNKIKTILNGISGSLKQKTRVREKSPADEKPVFITLQKARKDPALVREMVKQQHEASIISGSQTEYVAGIKFNGHQYYISGSHREWLSFYGMDGNVDQGV